MPLNIVIVDDDPISAETARALLEEAGHSVQIRDTAIGTTSFILRARPDLVLMDVDMPALSGPRLTEILRRQESRSRVILHSGKSGDELQALAASCAADGWICKDGQHGTFVTRVEQAATPLQSTGSEASS